MAKEQKEMRPEFDKRLIENKLLRGQMSEKQLAEHLKALPDVSENAEEVTFVIEERK